MDGLSLSGTLPVVGMLLRVIYVGISRHPAVALGHLRSVNPPLRTIARRSLFLCISQRCRLVLVVLVLPQPVGHNFFLRVPGHRLLWPLPRHPPLAF